MPIAQGYTKMATLRAHLQDVFRSLGNTHWGDSTDASLLIQALAVGILIFADRLQRNGENCLCSFALETGQYPFYLSIWWNEPIHFRSMEMRTTSADDFQSC